MKMKSKIYLLLCFVVILQSCKSDIRVTGAAKTKDKEGAGPSSKPVSEDEGAQSEEVVAEGDGVNPKDTQQSVGTLDDDDTVSRDSVSQEDKIEATHDSQPSESSNQDGSPNEDDEEEDEDDDDEEPPTVPQADPATMQHIYKAMFSARRAQHKEALHTIISMPDLEKQFKMVTLVLEKMDTVLTQHKIKLTEAGYTPGDPFPEDQSVREALSSVLENVALFGDLLLRLPDMISNMLSRKREWDIILRWGVGVAQLAGIYDEKDQKMLHLVSQEMEIVEKDPDYHNPYKDESREMRAKKEKELAEERKKEQKKKKKKEKKRGPRLSGGRTEL